MTTPTSLVTGVDFITVPTRDFDKAETGTLTIAVMQSDAFGIEFQPHTHPIALHVEDVGNARAGLESRGVSFAADTLDSGVCHMAHFADPDGNVLMLHHRYAPPA